MIRSLAGALPAVALVLAAGLCHLRTGRRDLRQALVTAGLFVSAGLLLASEVLSLFRLLRFVPLLLVWTAAVGGLGLAAHRARRTPVERRDGDASDRLTRWIVAATAGVLLVTGLVALLTPPNNWDALDYHLPRQLMWRQQGSLDLFPSSDVRRIAFAPFAELVGLHLFVLGGGDGAANVPQWIALVLTACAASLLAREAGAGRRGEALAALLAVANPMAAMQAENSKNDLVTAFFVLAFALEVVRRRDGDPTRTGLALGLAVATKATAFLFLAPFGIWLGHSIGRRGRDGLRDLATIAVLALALDAGPTIRNLHAFGLPFGPPDTVHTASVHTPSAVASRAVRDLGLHLGTPSRAVNAWLTARVEAFHDLIGASTHDPATTLEPTFVYAIVRRGWDEDCAAAPVHLLLVALASIALLRTPGPARWLLVATAAGFALFVVVLKFQPWGARLELPGVCLAAAVAAVVCGATPARAAASAALALVVLAPSLLTNDRKPLVGAVNVFRSSEDELRFLARPALREPAHRVAKVVGERRRAEIGLAGSCWHQEYLLTHLLLEQSPDVVLTEMDPGYALAPAREPDVVIRIRFENDAPPTFPGDRPYFLIAEAPPYAVFVKAGSNR